MQLFREYLDSLLANILPAARESAVGHVERVSQEWLDHPFFHKLGGGQLMGQYLEKNGFI